MKLFKQLKRTLAAREARDLAIVPVLGAVTVMLWIGAFFGGYHLVKLFESRADEQDLSGADALDEIAEILVERGSITEAELRKHGVVWSVRDFAQRFEGSPDVDLSDFANVVDAIVTVLSSDEVDESDPRVIALRDCMERQSRETSR